MIRKMLALLAIVTLLLGCTAALAEVEEITPHTLTGMNRTVSAWYANTTSREELAACLMLDLVRGNSWSYREVMASALAEGEIYVGKTGDQLVLVLAGQTKTYMALYMPSRPYLAATEVGTNTPASEAWAVMSGITESLESYYHLDRAGVCEQLLKLALAQ